MKLVLTQLGLSALCSLSPIVAQNAQGDIAIPAQDSRVLLHYGTFDPLLSAPEVPGTLRCAQDTHLWIVQFHSSPTDFDRNAVRENGARLVGALPHNAQVVRMSEATAAAVAVMAQVRWVGPYQPAYRLEGKLLAEHLSGAEVPVRTYNIVMADKRTEKAALEGKIVAMGGKVIDRHIEGLLFTVELTGNQLLMAARLDEVLWIDTWTAPGFDMDNARIVQGSNTVETLAGYTGSGIRGHLYEGAEFDHPDFNTPLTNVRSGGGAATHGHATAGCIFGNGNSAPQARGHAPDAVGFYTNNGTVTAGWSRNQVLGDVVNVHNCMFTTASWGGGQTTAYTSLSADADDIVFDRRIPWTNSMSNLGNQSVRPEAWAKNVISIGALYHQNNSNTADDAWSGGASIGPAADGRLKPDLCNFYDNVWTSDLSGAAGYNTAAGVAGNSTTGFGGTSAATPITAGLNALACQMYTDYIFNNMPRVSGGTRFQNRPYAQTLKALQIACATLYPIAQATRAEAGWGYANVATMYNRRSRMMIIPEDVPIIQGATHTYTINVLSGETSLKVCMTYLEPQGNPAAAQDAVNNLNLRVVSPGGTSYYGNVGLTAANTSASSSGPLVLVDSVENVILNNPTAGEWTITITAPTIATDAHTATAATDATYALVVNGGREVFGSGCARYVPDNSTTGTLNVIPFGTTAPSSLPTVFTSNNNGNTGGAVYYNLTPTSNMFITGLDMNTTVAVGRPITLDIYTRLGTHVGNEGDINQWTHRTVGHGVAAGLDQPSRVDFNEPILLGVSLYGFAIVARDVTHAYTNGNGANQTHSDANLTFSAGSATNTPFNGSAFSPRVANHNILYRLDTAGFNNQLYQTILRRGDLGAAGTINGLAFSPGSTGRHFNRQLRITMSHVAAGYTLSNTFATNLPTPVTVLDKLDYTWHTTADTFCEIGLTTPFTYNGTSDVVVQVFARGNHSTDPAGFHRGNGNVPRVYDSAFAFGSIPTTAASSDDLGQRIRVNFSCAVGSEFGTSCGPLVATHSGTPNLGAFAHFTLSNALPSSGVVIGLGLNSPSPTSLTGSGFLGCRVYNDLVTTLFKITSASGTSLHSIGIPNSTVYEGVKIYGQWFALDANQPGGLTVSNQIAHLLGIDP